MGLEDVGKALQTQWLSWLVAKDRRGLPSRKGGGGQLPTGLGLRCSGACMLGDAPALGRSTSYCEPGWGGDCRMKPIEMHLESLRNMSFLTLLILLFSLFLPGVYLQVVTF